MKQRRKREQSDGAKRLQGLHLHLDPLSGIAGDMTVAALVDAGVPARVVSEAVLAMGVPGLRVEFDTRRRGAFVGRGFVVHDPTRTRGARSVRQEGGHQTEHFQHADGNAHGHAHSHGHGHTPRHGHGHPHGLQARPAVRNGDGLDGHGHPARRDSGGPRSSGRSLDIDGHQHRDYAAIKRLLARASLDGAARGLAEELFARIAEVEASLHGTPVEKVAFHEVGAFDSIADIVGMSAALAWLAPASIGSTPPVLGTGTVRTAHGLVAVPAPATAALLRGIPTLAEGSGELTTPTGAAFLATVVDSFGPPPPWSVVSIGYGAGTRVIPDRANVLRVMLGEPIGRLLPPAAESLVVLEANIDDMTGQLLAALNDALFEAGALDVWSTPILMKKGRPAQTISALAEPAVLSVIEEAFFLNSTTLGVRRYPVSRRTLARAVQTLQTPFGTVDVKVGALDGAPITAAPEFEDCRRRALEARVPVRRVWLVASSAAVALLPSSSRNPVPVVKGPPETSVGAKPKDKNKAKGKGRSKSKSKRNSERHTYKEGELRTDKRAAKSDKRGAREPPSPRRRGAS